MAFRILLLIASVSLFGFSAEAGSKKSGKVKYETINGKKVQVENTEYVNDSPLNQPESALMRQRRQQMEMETEEEFIQKLENARIEDERLRREQLFQQQLKVIKSEEADPFMEPEPQSDNDYDYQPVTQTNELTTPVVMMSDPEPEQAAYYISIGAGALNHQANNVPDANGAGSAAVGVGLGNNFWLEGSFFYSFLESNRAVLADEDIDQFSFAASPKYSFIFPNRIVSINVGPVLAFTRRQYNAGDNSSNAIDAGAVAGIDVAINKSVTLGAEARYMTNLDYDKDQTLDSTEKAIEEFATGRNVQPLEEFDYTLFTVHAKMMF